MSDVVTSHGAGMGIVPVFAIREALINGIAVLASDQNAIEEMVNRDDNLRYSQTDRWKTELSKAVRDLADPTSPRYAEPILAYPAPLETAKLPAISVIESSGGENPGETYHGDLLRESYAFPVGPDQELIATSEKGAGYSSTVQIGAWATAAETGMLLHAMTKWAIYQQKDRLYERGVHDLSVRTSGVEIDPRLAPRVAYVPMLSVTMSWTLRQSHRRKVPNRVRFLTPTMSN